MWRSLPDRVVDSAAAADLAAAAALISSHTGRALPRDCVVFGEISLSGEVRAQADGSVVASLSGVVADPAGRVHGGVFVPGANPVCMTFEVTLEEWLPDGG